MIKGTLWGRYQIDLSLMQNSTPLRTHRKQWALKQRELAHLVGFKSRSSIADLEDGASFVGLQPALAFEFVFGAPLRELFPTVFLKVENEVMRQAAALDDAHRAKSDATAERIGELLRALVARASDTLPL